MPGPAAAQPRRHHQRDPRGRALRRGRLAADLPRGQGARRLLPLGARPPALSSAAMRSSGAPASTAATSRSPDVPRGAARRLLARAAARSPGPPSASAPATAARPSAASCAQLKLREPQGEGAGHTAATCSAPGTRPQRASSSPPRAGRAPPRARGRRPERALEDRVEERLTERAATFEPGELRAVVLEQSVGELSPREALERSPRDDRRAAGPAAGGRR